MEKKEDPKIINAAIDDKANSESSGKLKGRLKNNKERL